MAQATTRTADCSGGRVDRLHPSEGSSGGSTVWCAKPVRKDGGGRVGEIAGSAEGERRQVMLRVLALGVALAAALAFASAASADKPVSLCPDFDVLVHVLVNKEQAITFSSGATIIIGQLKVELTNLETDETVAANISAPSSSRPTGTRPSCRDRACSSANRATSAPARRRSSGSRPDRSLSRPTARGTSPASPPPATSSTCAKCSPSSTPRALGAVSRAAPTQPRLLAVRAGARGRAQS
jgi:hypothetical protein